MFFNNLHHNQELLWCGVTKSQRLDFNQRWRSFGDVRLPADDVEGKFQVVHAFLFMCIDINLSCVIMLKLSCTTFHSEFTSSADCDRKDEQLSTSMNEIIGDTAEIRAWEHIGTPNTPHILCHRITLHFLVKSWYLDRCNWEQLKSVGQTLILSLTPTPNLTLNLTPTLIVASKWSH